MHIALFGFTVCFLEKVREHLKQNEKDMKRERNLNIYPTISETLQKLPSYYIM
jgi:ribosomal protein S15P/S13E